MEYKYKRDLKNSFMIIETGFENAGYEKDILRYNDIDVLVPFHTVDINNVTQVWYDITGLVSLKDYLSQQGATIELLRKVMLYLKIAIDETERFLIDVNHLLIDIETIYVVKNNNEWKIMLIYYPDSKEQAGLESILEFFMNNVSKDMMDLSFRLYDRAMDGATIDEIITIIDDEIGNEVEVEIGNTESDVDEIREDDIGDNRTYSSKDSNNDIDDSFMSDDEDYIWGRDCGKDIFAEEETKPTLIEKIKKYFKEYFDNNKEDKTEKTADSFLGFGHKKERNKKESIWDNIKKKKEPDIAYEDFVYEPDQQIYEPTVLLKSIEDDGGLVGELQYMGNNKKENIRINKDEFRLGSSTEGNDSVIDSPVISRFHAKILREGKSYYIEDLNSTNGTTVNGKLLGYRDKILLNPDDKIMFADECYKIV